MKSYDLIVIGGGAAGSSLAHRTAAAGKKVALIEGAEMGGTCINRGCMPTKILVQAAKLYHTMQRSAEYGFAAGSISLDYSAVAARKDRIIGRMQAHSLASVEKAAGITLFAGQAAFLSASQVAVGGETLTAGKIVIATGSENFIPPIPGLNEVDYLTSTEALNLTQLPESVVFVGGGPIALEFAQVFARFGVAVTILEMAPRLLMMLDPEFSQEVQKTLEAEGIRVLTGVKVSRVAREEAGVKVTAMVADQETDFSAARLFLAAGRQANTRSLNLAAAGVAADGKGYIRVSDRLASSVPGIWAIGDARGGMMFTNTAWHDGFVLANFFNSGSYFSTRDQQVPYAIFTDPEIAVAGLTEQDAVKSGWETRTTLYPMRFSGRANLLGETTGLVKLVAEKGSGRLLGAQVYGANAGEFIHQIVMGLRFGCRIRDLQDMLHVHPTMAESIHNAAMAWRDN